MRRLSRSQTDRLFVRKFAECGIDTSRAVFQPFFGNTPSPMNFDVTLDYERLHTEMSVAGAAWLDRALSVISRPQIRTAEPSEYPSVTILMEG